MSDAARKVAGAAAAGLLAVALCAPLASMRGKSITFDEVIHVPAGVSYWSTAEVRLNPMHPPLVKELAALPVLFLERPPPFDAELVRRLSPDLPFQRSFGWAFFHGRDVQRTVVLARIPVVMMSFALAVLVWLWARELWGTGGALAALTLYVFDPTIMAHAQLVTTDVGLALFATLHVMLVRRAVARWWWSSCVAAGMALGLALATKFSALLLVPITIGLAALAYARAPREAAPIALAGFAGRLTAMFATAYVVVWAVYFFPLDPLFYPRTVATLKGDLSADYLYFFHGELGRRGWWSYLLVAWLIKTPLPTLALIAVAAGGAIAGTRRGLIDEAFLWVPPLGFAVANSLFAEPLGVRYLIPCFPFLFVAAGRIALMAAAEARSLVAGFVAVLCAWLPAEFARIWPDHLSYFNQAVGGSRGGLAWLDDSNVDWGQGLIQLRDYVTAQGLSRYRLCYFGNIDPRTYGVDGDLVWLDRIIRPPAPGTWILSATCVARLQAHLRRRYGEGPLNWLRWLDPKAVVGHAYYVYELTPGAVPGMAPADTIYPRFPDLPEE